MCESNCLACVNTNCGVYREIDDGIYPDQCIGDCPDMIWPVGVSDENS